MAGKHSGRKSPTRKSSKAQRAAVATPSEHAAPAAASENRANRTPIKESRPKWALPFLAHLRLRGSVSAASHAAGVGRRTVYDLRARDPIFRTMMDEQAESCIEDVEATLYQRAVSGESDRSTFFFLKTRKPEVYSEKRLRAEEIQEIRREAQRELVQELHARVAQLPETTRGALSAALAQTSQPAIAQLEAPTLIDQPPM
jgi:hypothetical protein